jgi:hypothetical protein
MMQCFWLAGKEIKHRKRGDHGRSPAADPKVPPIFSSGFKKM